MEKDSVTKTCIAFLNSIGIKTIEKEFEESSFLPGLKIEKGSLIIDKQKLLYPGDILHEAGHLAVAPGEERSVLNENVTDNRPGAEGEELAVMLWSYAACLHLGIDTDIVFHKDGYKGDSEWILNSYKEKTYIGLPLLAWMGMTAKEGDKDGFPNMIKWVRD